jgi:hypothetical protein
METHISCCSCKSFHSIFTVKEPVRLSSKGIDDSVFRVPGIIGHPFGATEHRLSTVGDKGIKLYVAE